MNASRRLTRYLIKNRTVILELAKSDFRIRYSGSHLGFLWAFIQPSIYIFILWFVFQVGFKSTPVKNFPYVLWLISGLIPWFFFSESLVSGTNAIIGSSYLVKKMVFKIELLPIIKLISSLFIHLFFVAILFAVFVLQGYYPGLFFLQVFYYLFATLALVLGLSYTTSALIILFRDTGQILAVVLQFCFWLTPIFWHIGILPLRYHAIIELNPVYYLTEGYRNSLINKIWFWQQPVATIYFWMVTSLICAFGVAFFRKAKPHLADVL
ncbi:MAG: ABC transporter permease [Elusimicrobiota bacterium]